MNEYSDQYIRDFIGKVETIALVGASDKPDRPSHRVMKFLQGEGFRVYPVNPMLVGDTLNGETVYADIRAIGQPIDMVDIFRRSEEAGDIVDQAIEAGAKSIWMQLGVIDDEAAKRATKAGLDVIMNRCPAIEMPRLGLTGKV